MDVVVDIAMGAPRDIRHLALADTCEVQGLFTDVDDTLTRDGKLGHEAYRALWALHEAGIQVIPVTGRSSGWANLMLSQWPVPAVIAESGGLYLEKITVSETLRVTSTTFHTGAETVRAERAELMDFCAKLLKNFPGLKFASDNWLRQVDVAIDFCEEVPQVAMEEVHACIDTLRAEGFEAKHSSVHINAWRGSFDKGPMAMRYLKDELQLTEEKAKKHWMFIGDAPNDSSMFAMFPRSVAVANISPYLPSMQYGKPSFLTEASHGAGFVELARLLLQSRGS